ncbi:MAG: PepSY domain-containing protein [Actinomycetota bacterium]|nr:PepSY domain-containing protein [Actinomycetota bacterium]
MKRSYAIAAAVGAAAVIGVTGTALAAGGDDAGSPSPSSSSVGPSEEFRGDGSPDDGNLDDGGTPSPFETVEPGSVAPVPGGSSSPPASSGLGDAVTSITIAQARSKALSAVGGGRVTKVEAETEHGRAVWEVEVVYRGAEHDLDIDRRTGAVTDHDVSAVRGGDDGRSDDKGRDDDRSGRHGGDDRGGQEDDDRGGRHGDDDDRGDDRSGRHGGDDRYDD